MPKQGLGFLSMSTPPVLSNSTGTCSDYKPECIGHTQKVLFYTAMALIAAGMSGHLVSLQPFLVSQGVGEDDNDAGRVPFQILGVFAVILVPVVGGIALPYIKPWSIRFGIPAICTLVATLLFLSGSCSYRYSQPSGSAMTNIFRVFIACTSKIFQQLPDDEDKLYKRANYDNNPIGHTRGLRCLDKAAIILSTSSLEEQERNRWKLCTVTEVEETKIVIRLVPLWMTFIICGVVTSIGNTYFLEQANRMDRKVGKIKVPLTILLLLYESAKSWFSSVYSTFASCLQNSRHRRFAPVVGIGVAIVFSVLCCITAAKVENRRIHVIRSHDLVDKPEEKIPMSIFWLLPQFFLLAGLDSFFQTSLGHLFADQFPPSLREYLPHFSLGACGLGIMGSVLSVYVAGTISQKGGKPSWFQYTLNKSRLDKYYWMLAAMSAVNLVFYILVAIFSRFGEASEAEEENGNEESAEPFEDNAECCCCCG